MDDFLLDQLTSIDRTFNELTERLGDPDVLSNPKLIMDVSKERASVEEVKMSLLLLIWLLLMLMLVALVSMLLLLLLPPLLLLPCSTSKASP